MSLQRSPTRLIDLCRFRRARRTVCSPTHPQRSLCVNSARYTRLFPGISKTLLPQALSQYAQLTLFLSLIAPHVIIPVGLLYAALAFLLSVCAFLRARHSRHDYADRNDSGDTTNILAIRTVGQDHKQLFVRSFVTARPIVCRDGDSPCSSPPDMNLRSSLNIVTMGSLTKCTPYAIIYNLYLNLPGF